LTFVFDAWQEADDLRVPRQVSFFEGETAAKKLGTITFGHARVSSDRPEPELFAIPAGAQVEEAP
jgi:hypothetical protein